MRAKSRIIKIKQTKPAVVVVKYYEDIEVDDDWLTEFKTVAKQREEIAAMSHMTAEERRKIQERMVAYTLRKCTKYRESTTASPTGYIWDKVEPRTSDLMNTETMTYYGKQEIQPAQNIRAVETLYLMSPCLMQ